MQARDLPKRQGRYNPHNKTPQQAVDRILSLSASGLNGMAIAQALSIGKSSVYRVLAAHGVDRRDYVKVEAIDPARLESLYRSGWYLQSIAKKLNCSGDTVKAALARAGIQITCRALRCHDQILEDYKSRHILRKIAARLGLGRSTVAAVIRSSGITIAYPSSRNILTINKQILRCKVLQCYNEASPRDRRTLYIARSLGIAKSTVRRHLVACGIHSTMRRESVRSIQERDRLFMQHVAVIKRLTGFLYRRYGAKLAGRVQPFEEFLSIAYVAALRAAELWEEDGRATFSTYMSAWIKKSIRKECARLRSIYQQEQRYLEGCSYE